MNSQENIYVDLDYTLVRTDLFFESSIKYLKQNPLRIVLLILWILKGRSYAKNKLADTVSLDPETLIYEIELVDFLKRRKAEGAKISLATASNYKYAEAIAKHFGFFDDIIASSEHKNVKGKQKLKHIQEHCGSSDFTYAGDSKADIPIWEKATGVIIVNGPTRAIEKARNSNKLVAEFSTRMSLLKAFFKAMRPHQYAKNFLIFVPLLTSHLYTDPDSIFAAIIAFFCFSICASGVYFLNDLVDLDADRQHLTKKNRPLCSGNLPLPFGMIAAAFFPLISLLVALFTLPVEFLVSLTAYFLLTNFYSFGLKRVATLDVITLSLLYTVRVIAGGMAIGVTLSSWLLVFSIFTFVSLAYLKRYVELSKLDTNKQKSAKGRGYSISDNETVFTLGIANITAAVVILSLYITSSDVMQNYSNPQFLWGLVLLFLTWSNHIWTSAKRGIVNDDPVLFSVKDKISLSIAVFGLLLILWSRYSQLFF